MKDMKSKVLHDVAWGSSVEEDHRVAELAVYIFRPKNIISLQMALFTNLDSLYKNNKLIYAHKKSTAVPAPISPKLTNVNRTTYVQISYTKFHPNWEYTWKLRAVTHPRPKEMCGFYWQLGDLKKARSY